ncbi:hypothetical protein KKC32_02865 [Patescibacteria group bacterium]|nr:hypothetical protein [Patescibacteria group bacterium]
MREKGGRMISWGIVIFEMLGFFLVATFLFCKRSRVMHGLRHCFLTSGLVVEFLSLAMHLVVLMQLSPEMLGGQCIFHENGLKITSVQEVLLVENTGKEEKPVFLDRGSAKIDANLPEGGRIFVSDQSWIRSLPTATLRTGELEFELNFKKCEKIAKR